MKQILVELDEKCATDLERVAPARHRKRAEFIRLAIRRAIDLALDRGTQDAYVGKPFDGSITSGDLEGWDDDNALATPAPLPRKARVAKKKRAA